MLITIIKLGFLPIFYVDNSVDNVNNFFIKMHINYMVMPRESDR